MLKPSDPKAASLWLCFLLLCLFHQSVSAGTSPPAAFKHMNSLDQTQTPISLNHRLIELSSTANTKRKLERRRALSPKALLTHDQRRTALRARAAEDSLRGNPALLSYANATNSSASNPGDKLTQLGFLGNAYNAALNLSTDATGGSQLVFVQLDTASADLWVVSQRCTKATSAACASSDIFRFDESKSSSFAALELSTSGASGNQSIARRMSMKKREEVVVGWGARLRRRWLDILSLSGFNAPNLESGLGIGSSALGNTRVASSNSTLSSSSGGRQTVPFSITYADQTSASGIVGVEDITFAELSTSRQAFGLVDQTNVTLLQQGISGVLGLGFARGSSIAQSLVGMNLTGSAISNFTSGTESSSLPPSTSPLLTTLLSSTQSNASYPLFSLALNSSGGRMSIGAVDPFILSTAKDRDLVDWHDVVPFPLGDSSQPLNSTANQQGSELGPYVYWALPLAMAGVNGSSANLSASALYTNYVGTSPLAIIDSGTRGILGPVAAVADLYSHIPSSRHVGNGQWVVPCDTDVRMHFGFGAGPDQVVRNITLLPTQYLIGPASGNPNLCFSWVAASLDLPSADGLSWTFGVAFLQAAYTIFSLGIDGKEPPKIGLFPMDASLANLTLAATSGSGSGSTQLSPSASAVLFAPEPSASISSWLANNATTIASNLPNSLVPLPTLPDYYTPTYAFASATARPTAGSDPTTLAGQPTYKPVITAVSGNGEVPVIANDTTVQPLPSNPAAAAAAAAAKGGAIRSGSGTWTGSAFVATGLVAFVLILV
ncbi:hypothetical protein OC846_004841 [Tilletia horrida]|uniref:Peptidase A1 domain-containing protein n=1 Tax=Tilletia horrida TaxID=155126 RepID=A0AAN6GP19_9BASI|nr:hypothetical protein OC846_004841 [Tilletia horrida]